MATRLIATISTVALSAIVLAPVVGASLAVTANTASAKSEKSSGTGSRGNSGNSSASHGNSQKDKDNHGRVARELKGRNSLNAMGSLKNGKGYRHANVDSNVGQIAHLKEVVSETTAAKNELAEAKNNLVAYLKNDLTDEEILDLIEALDPNSEDYNPDINPSDFDGDAAGLINDVTEAHAAYGVMTNSFDEALSAATGGRVLSTDALEYFRNKLGF